MYRDIKGANLLVDAYGVVKLADFGMAKHVSSQLKIWSILIFVAITEVNMSLGDSLFLEAHACSIVYQEEWLPTEK